MIQIYQNQLATRLVINALLNSQFLLTVLENQLIFTFNWLFLSAESNLVHDYRGVQEQ